MRTNEFSQSLPPSVNWHFWPWCNYGCKFCFARFEDIPRAQTLKKELALTIPKLLVDSGAEKLTFVGGEPTLCPYLNELLVEAKRVGLTTCIVSNATGLNTEFLNRWNSVIDWVGLSIDASNNKLHAEIGRGLRKDLAAGRSHHLEDAKKVWNDCRSLGIKMKLNTVVCKSNLDDDMSDLVLQLKPERWKIFEVLPVDGQNDGDVDELLLEKGEFESWLNRHSWVSNVGIPFISESNDEMRGSYAMLDALGRFYTNDGGGHEYGQSILDIGVVPAWKKNIFHDEKFLNRGGIYDWKVTK